MKPTVKRYQPQTRLRELVVQAGGKAREQAVADAEANVETLRDECSEGVAEAVSELATMLLGPDAKNQSERKVLALTDRIVTLSSNFGFDRLRVIADELAGSILETGEGDGLPPEAARIYVGALRLFLPGAAALSDEQAQQVMSEVSRLRAHLARS